MALNSRSLNLSLVPIFLIPLYQGEAKIINSSLVQETLDREIITELELWAMSFTRTFLVQAPLQRPTLKDRLPRTQLLRDLMVFTVAASLMKRH